MWVAWYAYMQDDVLATGIMSFVMHEIVYFGRSLPWIIIDRMRFFNQYKIQNQKVPTSQEQWKCAKLVLLSHFTVELPQIWYDIARKTKSQRLIFKGSSTPWRSTSAFLQLFPFLQCFRCCIRSPFFSSLRIPGTTSPTDFCILLTFIRKCTKYTTSTLHRSAWQPNMLLQSKS